MAHPYYEATGANPEAPIDILRSVIDTSRTLLAQQLGLLDTSRAFCSPDFVDTLEKEIDYGEAAMVSEIGLFCGQMAAAGAKLTIAHHDDASLKMPLHDISFSRHTYFYHGRVKSRTTLYEWPIYYLEQLAITPNPSLPIRFIPRLPPAQPTIPFTSPPQTIFGTQPAYISPIPGLF